MLFALVAASLPAGTAFADPPADPQPTSPKRPLPSYDGRAPTPTQPSRGLLWIPRVLLAPLYAVSEFVLRAPLSVVVPAAEKVDLFTNIYDFFAFGKDHKVGIFPIGFVEFGFKPSVGLYAFWNDAGFRGNNLSLHVEAWPDDWLVASGKQLVRIDDRSTFLLGLSEVHRPDKVFYGIGPRSLAANRSRYGLQRVEGEVAYEWRFWRSSRVAITMGARDVSVFDGHYGADPSLAAEAATGAFTVPFGFDREYTAQYNRVVAAVDNRVSESRRGSGVRLELDGEQASDVRNAPLSSWIHYGATAAGYVDLTGTRRVLALSLTAQFVDPLGPEPVPFTELIYLGGDHAMRGFYAGRLVDRSAAVATLSYAWPIAPWVDGDLQVALGDVFGAHLAGLDAKLLRFSGAFGLSIGGLQKTAVMGSQDAPVEILVGIGSETFEQGGQIDSLCVLFGVPVAF